MDINISSNIPLDDEKFQYLIKAFVFNCPSAIVISKKKEKTKKYENISARKSSFRNRGITGTLLNTMTSQIKKNVLSYQKVVKNQRIEETFDKDYNVEKIIFKENAQMSDAETVFYYIRNAFAHGSFEYLPEEKIYKLESKKKDSVKAQMILKESTLKKLADLSALDKTDVEKLQKPKKPKKK